MAGGRKEISPRPTTGSRESQVTRCCESQSRALSHRDPDGHHSHNLHNFLPGEGQEQAEEASLLRSPSAPFNAVEAQAGSLLADEKHFIFMFKLQYFSEECVRHKIFTALSSEEAAFGDVILC